MVSKERFWMMFPFMFSDCTEGKEVNVTEDFTMSMKRQLPGEHNFGDETQFFRFQFEKKGYQSLAMITSAGVTTEDKYILPLLYWVAMDAYKYILQYLEEIENGTAKKIGDK